MRRRLSLTLLALLVVVLVFAAGYVAGNRTGRRIASADTLAQLDSAAQARARAADTMCVAARFGLPCDPR